MPEPLTQAQWRGLALMPGGAYLMNAAETETMGLERVLATLEAQHAALVDLWERRGRPFGPVQLYSDGKWHCSVCEAEAVYSLGALVHDKACPWEQARALVEGE